MRMLRNSFFPAALAVLALACGGASEPAAESAPQNQPVAAAEAKPMDPADVKRRLDAGERLFLLDVRRPDELVEHGMIEGAVNIPIDELEARLAEVPKDTPIVTYCMRGGRASTAAKLLREKGYEQPIETGGITEWKEAGLPVVEPKSE